MVNAASAINNPPRDYRTSDCFGTFTAHLADAMCVSITPCPLKLAQFRRSLIARWPKALHGLPPTGRGWLLIEAPLAPPARTATQSVGVPPDP